MIELSRPLLILLNFGLWPAWLVGIALLSARLPLSFFEHRVHLFRPRSWEQDGRIYERWFRVRRWKHRLPDGAALLGAGQSQRSLSDPGPAALRRFALETCRSELYHTLGLLPVLLFPLWNPWWAGLIMLAFGLAVNLPCLIAQRYNRARLWRFLERGSRPTPITRGDAI